MSTEINPHYANCVKEHSINSRLDECMVFIGDVLGKNLLIAVDNRGSNSFGHLVLKEDRLWYIQYAPDVLDANKGTAKFRRFYGVYKEIPDNVNWHYNSDIDMSFHIEYNLTGDIRNNK